MIIEMNAFISGTVTGCHLCLLEDGFRELEVVRFCIFSEAYLQVLLIINYCCVQMFLFTYWFHLQSSVAGH